MLPRLIAKAPAADVAQLELDDGPLEGRRVRAGIGEIVTGDDRTRIDDVKCLVPLASDRRRVGAPDHLLGGRQRRSNGRILEEARDERNVIGLDEILSGHRALLHQIGERATARDRRVGSRRIFLRRRDFLGRVGLLAGVGVRQ